MLDKVLQDIRGVGGVTGVAIVAKREGKVEHLFPAAFTGQHIERLLRLIRDSYQRLRGFARLELRFERVQVFLINQPEYLLFATTLPDCDVRLLNTVVKSKLPAIARSLESAHALNSPISSAFSTKQTPVTAPVRSSGTGNAAAVIDMINAFATRIAQKRGMVRLADDWRRAKQAAQHAHPCLVSLAIESSGKLAQRKGSDFPDNDSGVAALAALLGQLFLVMGALRNEAEVLFFDEAARNESILEASGLLTHMSVMSKRGSLVHGR